MLTCTDYILLRVLFLTVLKILLWQFWNYTNCSSGYNFLNQLKSAPPRHCFFWHLEWIPSSNRTWSSEFLFFYCVCFPDFYFHFYFWFLAMFGSDSGLHSQCVISHNRRIETYSFSDMTGQRIRHISFLACRKISLASTGEKKSPLRSRSVSIFCVSFNL